MRSRYDSQVSYIQPPFNCKKQAIDKAVVCLKISWQPKRIELMSNHRPLSGRDENKHREDKEMSAQSNIAKNAEIVENFLENIEKRFKDNAVQVIDVRMHGWKFVKVTVRYKKNNIEKREVHKLMKETFPMVRHKYSQQKGGGTHGQYLVPTDSPMQ